MTITNHHNIQAWSQYSQEDIEAFGPEGDASRRYLLNPILFRLIGDPQGKEILDVGAGTGYLSRLLAKQGANVTALEPAESLFKHAQQQEEATPLGITLVQQDLSHFTPENSFDLVIANMVLMDIPDYEHAMKNCIRSLKPTGKFIFSVSHPCFPGSDSDWQVKKLVEVRQYFEISEETNKYGQSWRRPIQDYLHVLFNEGCVVTNFIEPRPDLELVKKEPIWERNYAVPQFLVVEAEK